MELQDFIKEIVEKTKQELGTEYLVESRVVPKINNQILHGIQIRMAGQNIAPCVYINAYYKRYLEGDESIEEIVEDVICTYRANAVTKSIDFHSFSDFNNVRTRIYGRLLNKEMNEHILEDHPHRNYLDFVLMYYVGYDAFLTDSPATISITKQHAEAWGVTENDLFEQMKQNMYMNDEGQLTSIMDVLCNRIGDLDNEIQLECPMYVLTNKNHLFGAVQILNEEMMKSAEEIFHGDFYILPSSLHELILLPKDQSQIEQLVEIVRTVNENDLWEGERLSYHVYEYDSANGQVSIAA